MRLTNIQEFSAQKKSLWRPSARENYLKTRMHGWPNSRHAGSADNSKIRSRGLIAIASNKLTKDAARKQQRLLMIIGVGFNCPQEDDVVAAVISVGGSALEIGDAVGQDWCIAKSGRPNSRRQICRPRIPQIATPVPAVRLREY